jgi:hypothetical protein
LVGTKRDSTIVKSSSISEPNRKKKKDLDESEDNKRSDNMDKKLLEKRQKDDMEVKIWNKPLKVKNVRRKKIDKINKDKEKKVNLKETLILTWENTGSVIKKN